MTSTIKKEKTAVFILGDVPLGAYVWRIAQNKANDLLRKKIRRLNHEQMTDPVEGFSALTQHAAPEDNDTRLLFSNVSLVRQLLAKLKAEKPQYEQLIRLHYYEDMSYQEIADSKLTPYNTEDSCKSHTNRAKKKLLEFARAEGVFHYEK